MRSTTHDYTLGDHVLLLWSRRYVIIGATVGAAVLAYVLSSLAAPIYRATATLIISNPKMPAANGDARPDAAVYTSTYATLLKGEAVTTRVVQALELEQKLALPADRLARLLAVRTVPNTLLLTVSLDFADADWAARIVNMQTAKAVELSKTIAMTDLTDTRAYLQEQVAASRRELVARQEEFQNIKAAAPVDGDIERLKVLIGVRGKIEEQLTEAEQQAAGAQQSANSIAEALARQTKIVTLTRSVIEDPALKDVAATAEGGRSPRELLGLQMRSEEVNPLFERSEPELVKATAEAAGAKARRDAAHRQLRENLAAVQTLERDMAVRSTRFEAAKREYELAKASYENFSKSFENARLSVPAQAAELKVVTAAVAHRFPVGPRVGLNTAVAAFTAAMLAAFAILAIDGLRQVGRRPAVSVAPPPTSPSLRSAR